MPIKLIPPREGFSPCYYGRGTYLGVFVNRSTGTARAAIAKRVIKQWEDEIERGRFSAKAKPTFLSAAVSYMQAGGERIYLRKLIDHLGETPLEEIDQAVVDGAAATLYPSASGATRNRQVYTPISAILRHAKVALQLARPKGAQGEQINEWLEEDEAFALLREAANLDQEFATLCTFLLYTGCRLSEALKMPCKAVKLAANECFCGKTKNGAPRRVFLPTTLVAMLSNHPRGLDRKDERLFRFTKGKHVYKLLRKAAANAGVTLPRRCAFHLFRHTYATWMRRHAGADVDALVGTGAWKSRQAASRYMHMVLSEEAKRAALLPAPKSKSG